MFRFLPNLRRLNKITKSVKSTNLKTNLGLRLTFCNLAECVLHRGMLYNQYCSYLSGGHFY